MSRLAIPFGSYKSSGFGRELVANALELFLETKVRTRVSDLSLLTLIPKTPVGHDQGG
jgi:hypothetical protein